MEDRFATVSLIIDEGWHSGQFKNLALEWCESKDTVLILWELSQQVEHKTAWRAAYLLDLIHDQNPMMIEPYLIRMINRVQHINNSSVIRHYLRILSQHQLSEIADGHLVDKCFQWLGTESTPIAVKAHCMTILHQLCIAYPDLAYELKTALVNLLPYASKGEANKAKKILEQIDQMVD